MTQSNASLSEACVRKTNPPVRLRMASKDVLSRRSMEVEWENAVGNRQTWSSWTDPMCGCFDAELLLPSNVTRITVQFKVRTIFGAFDVYKKTRDDTCLGSRWAIGPRGVDDYIVDVFKFRYTSRDDTLLSSGCAAGATGVDATFELAGPAFGTHIRRAWNAGRDGPLEPWEFWEDEDTRPRAEWPAALKAADEACAPCSPSEDPEHDCEIAYRRVLAAVIVLQEIRGETISRLQFVDQQLTRQWVSVNSVNTLTAGISIASAVTLFVAPPVGVGLGVCSAAGGVGAIVGDVIADRTKLSELRQQMSLTSWNEVAVSGLYEAWMRASRRVPLPGRPVAMEQFCFDDLGQGVRASAAVAKTIALLGEDGLILGARAGVAAIRGFEGVAEGAEVAKVAARGVGVTAKALGAAAAFVSTGIAIHGWSNRKQLQKTVRERRDNLVESMRFTERWVDMMSKLECPASPRVAGFFLFWRPASAPALGG